MATVSGTGTGTGPGPVSGSTTTPDTQARLRGLLLRSLQFSLVNDERPTSIAHAVYAIRGLMKLGVRQFAAHAQVSHVTILRLESATSRGTPSVLLRLGDVAASQSMGNTAEYLRIQAQAVEHEVRTKGGKR